MLNEKVIIYTDGSARGNPGPAGWGVVFVFSKKSDEKIDKIFEIGGRSSHATNNQMELTAVIEAMKHLHKSKINAPVEIFSDSKYVILGITEWVQNWIKNNWRNAVKKPVLNRELWEELNSLVQDFKIKWNYVEGHSGDKWNERADEIATSFADGFPVKLENMHHAG